MRIEALDTGAKFLKAESSEVLTPGPDRVEPACKVFGRCGGCSWQHISYEAQAAAKLQILRDAIERIGKFRDAGEIEFVPSPAAYGYRGRTRVVVSDTSVGFRKWRGHEIEPIETCPVLAPALDRGLAEFAARVRAGEQEGVSESEEEWALAVDFDDQVHCARVAGGTAGDVKAMETASSDDSRIALRVGNERVHVSPGGFAQGNPLMFDELYRAVETAFALVKRELLIELFAGAGFFTVGLSRMFERTIAVESDKTATRDLAKNLEVAGSGRVKIRRERVENALTKLGSKRPNAVLLDPPRAGLARGAAERVARLGAGRIAYLSCDPATLARDLKIICTNAETGETRYKIARLVGFDLFPQTPHVEALAVLERVA